MIEKLSDKTLDTFSNPSIFLLVIHLKSLITALSGSLLQFCCLPLDGSSPQLKVAIDLPILFRESMREVFYVCVNLLLLQAPPLPFLSKEEIYQ